MLKKLLLVGAIVTIIPLERQNQADLYQVAKLTVADISSFCIRNPDVCKKSNVALEKLASKAEFGARMMVDIARDQSGPNDDAMARLIKSTRPEHHLPNSNPQPATTNKRFPSYRDKQYNEHYRSSSNTLNLSDLNAGWSGRSIL